MKNYLTNIIKIKRKHYNELEKVKQRKIILYQN